MVENAVERRLAAILAADVVGYSKLMGQDETGTLAALRKLRSELVDPRISEHKGRVFKTTGDGLLAEFPSVVNAVACAVGIQKAMAAHNGDLPGDRLIQFRIGVNLGDVIIEGEDVFGDGVNVAARIEGMAPPGGVAISAMVRDNIGNRLDLQFEDLGEQALKNIEKPLRVLLVLLDVPAHSNKSNDHISTKLTAGERPSIAVLPFINLSDDREQDYFSDGITEDIITELSRWHQLSVLSRNSTFQFRDKAADLKHVGGELGAQYIVEGSVRPIGERLRMTVQLIDVTTGSHVWAERYDRDRQEIFAVQDDVVQTIAGTLVGRVQADRAAIVKRKPPGSLAAYECVLRGHALPWGTPGTAEEARKLYERAIELDPGYALAHAELALSFYSEWANEGGEDDLLDHALALANRSVELDENESYCVFMLGHMHLFRRSYATAEEYHRRAMEMNPNDPQHLADYGFCLMYLGRLDEAWEWASRAKRVDPFFSPSWYWHQQGLLHYTSHRYDDAIAAYERSPSQAGWIPAYIGACHAQAGRIERAYQLAAETLRRLPGFSLCTSARREPFKNPANLEHLLDGLRKAGVPE